MYPDLVIPDSPLSGPHRIYGDKVEKAVIFLHGYGTNGNDLMPLCEDLSTGLKNVLFTSPHAPAPCLLSSSGRQWFDLDTNDIIANKYRDLHVKAEKAYPYLDSFITALLGNFGLAAHNLVLIGFSQGAMMALQSALNRQQRLAGVISVSGALSMVDNPKIQTRATPPVSLIHGQDDQVVPFAFMGQAATYLAENGVEVFTHAIPGLGHGIDNRALKSIYNMMCLFFTEE